jgi:hypothetical protein
LETCRFTTGSNAPGWWFGIQTADGDGALIQPILAWGYQGAKYSMFNGVFDWTDASWRTSKEMCVYKKTMLAIQSYCLCTIKPLLSIVIFSRIRQEIFLRSFAVTLRSSTSRAA